MAASDLSCIQWRQRVGALQLAGRIVAEIGHRLARGRAGRDAVGNGPHLLLDPGEFRLPPLVRLFEI